MDSSALGSMVEKMVNITYMKNTTLIKEVAKNTCASTMNMYAWPFI
jgi:hypothetical protein